MFTTFCFPTSQFISELTNYKAKSEQVQMTEQKNQELKAKIICLDQNVTDTQKEVEVLQKYLNQQKEKQMEIETSLEERIEELKNEREEVSKKLDEEKESLERRVFELQQQNVTLTSELEETNRATSSADQDGLIQKLSEELEDLRTR
jgi:chromosome segregation ATPase